MCHRTSSTTLTESMENKIYIGYNGRKLVKVGCTRRLYWSQQSIDMLKRYYPTTSCRDIADMLNMGIDGVKKKASELGLKKDTEHRRRVNHSTLKIANLHSRLYGNKGRIRKGQRLSPATEYKPKHTLIRLDTGFIGTSREIAKQIGADQSNVVAAAKRKGKCKKIDIRFYDTERI